jgi:seryl-tRNA synthetase
VDFDAAHAKKEVNDVQKQISAKKKVGFGHLEGQFVYHDSGIKAKEPADDLVATKKGLDAKVEAIRKDAKELEATMRQKASLVGNIVGKDVPVSQTEVRTLLTHILLQNILMEYGRTIMLPFGRGILLRKRTSLL